MRTKAQSGHGLAEVVGRARARDYHRRLRVAPKRVLRGGVGWGGARRESCHIQQLRWQVVLSKPAAVL